jgi:hypothetical protein
MAFVRAWRYLLTKSDFGFDFHRKNKAAPSPKTGMALVHEAGGIYGYKTGG